MAKGDTFSGWSNYGFNDEDNVSIQNNKASDPILRHITIDEEHSSNKPFSFFGYRTVNLLGRKLNRQSFFSNVLQFFQ